MATATKATGCYKCGKTGHWARDCPVPSSEWINKQSNPSQAKTAAADKAALQDAQLGLNSGENDPVNEQDKILPTLTSHKRKRPKVTVELLKQPKGLDDICNKFPDAFRKHFKGKGHEVGDLRRLLEMYKRWQERIFPSSNFDTFIMKIEQLSGTNLLKHHIQTRRTKIIEDFQREHAAMEAHFQDALRSPALPYKEAPMEEDAAGAQQQQAQCAALTSGDDDDLDGLLYETNEPAEPFELNDPMVMDHHHRGKAQQHLNAGSGAAAPAADEFDGDLFELSEDAQPNDDELALADFMDEEEQQHENSGGKKKPGPDSVPAEVAPATGAGANVDEEDGVLIELVAEEEAAGRGDNQEQDGAEACPGAPTSPPPGNEQDSPSAVHTGGKECAPGGHIVDDDLDDAELLALAASQPAPAQQEAQQQDETRTAAGAVLATEASGATLAQLGTDQVVNAAYRQVAALHTTETPSQLDIDDEELLRMVAEAD